MSRVNRRQALSSLVTGAALLAAPEAGAQPRNIGPKRPKEGAISPSGLEWAHMKWPRGIENQRKADLGNGRYLNPIIGGDHPDPSIVKDGKDYYATFSTFDSYPGLLIWHSRDLVNWRPLSAALKTPIGSVWAPDLCKYRGRYYIYIPTRRPNAMYVIQADRIEGPWSEPVELTGLGKYIDPNHVVGEDGKRYLALSGGDLVPLTDDGLAVAGAPKHIYDPWQYPEDWTVESFSPEGPKIFRRGEYFYMLTAVGGTAGPPTGHMVIAARSRSLFGPWQNDPCNPLIRTWSAAEKWWSRGHASAIEGPDGSWWLIYHGYENGFWTLGRQPLLAPMRWTRSGWIEAGGGDLSKPLVKPKGGEAVANGQAKSDDFSTDRLGELWSFYLPEPSEAARLRFDAGTLTMQGKGSQPCDCSPLCLTAGDLRYQCEVELEVSGEAQAGLLLFYNKKLYCGLGNAARGFVQHRAAIARDARRLDDIGRHVFLRITDDANIVTVHFSADGQSWRKYGVQMEVSGYNHNTGYDFLALKPALFVAGAGYAQFRNFKYRAL
jgi:xylan 1,4-beta-xylosidase